MIREKKNVVSILDFHFKESEWAVFSVKGNFSYQQPHLQDFVFWVFSVGSSSLITICYLLWSPNSIYNFNSLLLKTSLSFVICEHQYYSVDPGYVVFQVEREEIWATPGKRNKLAWESRHVGLREISH